VPRWPREVAIVSLAAAVALVVAIAWRLRRHQPGTASR
jgi:hypothetical protein